MEATRIPDGDSLFRHCIHPFSFKGTRRDRFAHNKLLHLEDEGDGGLRASLAWQRYVPTVAMVHSSGCRLARGMNNDMLQAGTFDTEKRRIYCGSCELTARSVRSMAGAPGLERVQSADVVHHIEHGEIAHADLVFRLLPGDELDLPGTMTAIVDRVWHAHSGPLRHICESESEMADHPSAKLDDAPLGPYIDARPGPVRLWSLIRYYVAYWLWTNFGKSLEPAG
jgi:hypothetical protein